MKRLHGVMAATGAVLAFALGACTSSTPLLFMGDGRPTTQVQCQQGDFASCAAQAGAQCGNAGFDAVGDTVQAGTRTLVFACRRQKSAP